MTMTVNEIISDKQGREKREYQFFLEETKKLIYHVEENKENGIMPSKEEEQQLKFNKSILQYLETAAKIQLVGSLTQGDTNCMQSYLDKKEKSLFYRKDRTKSNKRGKNIEEQLARIRELKISLGLEQTDILIRELTQSFNNSLSIEENLYLTAQKICKTIVDADEYTAETILNRTSGSGFLNFDGTHLIHEGNIMLAQELLSGNTTNYQKFKEINDLEKEKINIEQALEYKSLGSYLTNYLVSVNSYLDTKKEQENLTKVEDKKTGFFKKVQKNSISLSTYQNELQAKLKEINSFMPKISSTIHAIRKSGFPESEQWKTENGMPIIPDEFFHFDDLFQQDYESLKDNVRLANTILSALENNSVVLDRQVHNYITEKTASLNTKIDSIKKTIPDNLKTARFEDMSRISYYGRGRIGKTATKADQNDELFTGTRIGLKTLQNFSHIYQETTSLIPKHILSDEIIKKTENNLYQNLDTAIEGKARK